MLELGAGHWGSPVRYLVAAIMQDQFQPGVGRTSRPAPVPGGGSDFDLSRQLAGAATRAMLRNCPEWNWRKIATGHDAMVTAPDELASMLEEIAA